MTDYERGRIDGYCGILVRYPNNDNYMLGYSAGYSFAEKEYYATLDDRELPSGVSDANIDQHYRSASC
jgi:hypothetical protein